MLLMILAGYQSLPPHRIKDNAQPTVRIIDLRSIQINPMESLCWPTQTFGGLRGFTPASCQFDPPIFGLDDDLMKGAEFISMQEAPHSLDPYIRYPERYPSYPISSNLQAVTR